MGHGKGFQNFMSKKDFHPSAWWNLKKKWESEQKRDLEQRKQNELRAQYMREQEVLNDKVLLGDEKAKLGLSFMYDAPTGIDEKKQAPEPKFEWQRKYNAPREEWAKGNELITDQPFGIQVRNVRCVKCGVWGHLNTDNECPLYGMSGNAENRGYANNPSDLAKQLESERKVKREATKSAVPMDQFPDGMREAHNLKAGAPKEVRADEGIKELISDIGEGIDPAFKSFLNGLSEKKRGKLLRKILKGSGDASISTGRISKGEEHKEKKSNKEHKERRHSRKEKHHQRRR